MGRVLQHLLVSLSLLVSVDGVSLGLLKTQIASTIFCSRLTNDRRVGTFTTGTSCPGTLNTALDNVCTGGPSTIPATNVPSGLGGFFYATSDDCSAVFGSATDTVLVSLVDSVFFAGGSSPQPAINGWQHWGCFTSAAFLITHKTPTYDGFTKGTGVEECIKYCNAATPKTEWAAVIDSRCFCYNDAIDPNRGTDICSTKCKVGEGFCGGFGALSVFRRSIIITTFPQPILDPTSGPRYLSCFNGAAYPLGNYMDDITVTMCTGYCAGLNKKYSVVSEDYCYCTDTKPNEVYREAPGHCTRVCAGSATQACGGFKLDNLIAITNFRMVSVYETKRPTGITTAAPIVGSVVVSTGFTFKGCYTGGLYLLDTLISGVSIIGLSDAAVCIDGCLKKSPTYTFAIVLGGTCLCHTRGPTSDLTVGDAAKCDEPCTQTPTQRCGGFDTTGVHGRALISVYSSTAAVSGFRYLVKLCSVLLFTWIALGKYVLVCDVLG